MLFWQMSCEDKQESNCIRVAIYRGVDVIAKETQPNLGYAKHYMRHVSAQTVDKLEVSILV